jgi:hypothetical protein
LILREFKNTEAAARLNGNTDLGLSQNERALPEISPALIEQVSLRKWGRFSFEIGWANLFDILC